MNKKAITAGVLSVLAIVSTIFGFGTANSSQKSNVTKYKNWMSSIADNTELKDINIPGSHDTMALYSIADLAGKCQSLSLSDQLNLGIRFLDIRLQLYENELRAVHGIVDEKASFKEIIITIQSFLERNSSEFIIMSIKNEADPVKSTISFEDALKKHVTPYWLTGDTMPDKLTSDIRGKVILLSRYENSTIGVPAYNGWQDNASFTLPNGIYVQDEYKVKDISSKKTSIENCFTHDGLKINFLSGYKTNGFPPSYAPSVANEINPWINNKIKSVTNRGIALYDFVTSNLMKGWFE